MRPALLASRARFLAAFALLAGLLASPGLGAQQIDIVSDDSGRRLQVDGEDFMVLGMNWDYFPRGTTNPAYNFWAQSDEFIKAALDREMSLLRTMGVNSIRLYQGIQPKWVEYIYDTYGILSIINHTLGRYGLDYMGGYIPNTDYSDPSQRQVILDQVEAMVREFEGTRGILMWLLGNENNYGLVWTSAETENLPAGEADELRATYMYSLFGDATELIQSIDPDRPVAMANGDLQYIDIIAEEVSTLDIMGSNVYRGRSARDFWQVIEDKMGIPAVFTEFGADRFDAQRMTEDQETQASYLVDQWQEIYEQAAGKGRVGNSIGGMTFQWTDGWWKVGQTDRLDIQDTSAGWANDAYPEDYLEGTNNMNEEWWGIVAKGETDAYGFYDLYPRAAFYALKRAYELDPYGQGVDLARIREHFGRISAQEAAIEAVGSTAAMKAEGGQKAFFKGLRLDFETYSTGGRNIATPEDPVQNPTVFPAAQGFDQKQSFWADFGARPAPNIEADISFNVLGAVPTNPIDEIFYENRGRSQVLRNPQGEEVILNDLNRVAVYSASMSWEEKDFILDGFYRTGHYHWGYEGDMFGIYREANYGPNLDIYNGLAPIGFELTGKRRFEGLSIAGGPELWWAANPQIMGKYTHRIMGAEVTGLFQEEFGRQGGLQSSLAIPLPENRRASIHIDTDYKGVGVELGGLWSGSKLEGRTFQLMNEDDTGVLQDEVKAEDTFGGRARLTYQGGGINWYAQGAIMGLVADGGPTQIQTFTGWRLADSGTGNQTNFMTGFTYRIGDLEIAPNFLWQKPIVGPVLADAAPQARPRNILDDPFAVRANREMTAAELLFTWDPTPATWMYAWDNNMQEDAELAISAGFVYRHLPTTMDAAVGFLPDGRTPFAFPGAVDPEDLWEINARIVSKQAGGLGLIANIYGGNAQPNGDDNRVINRFGADVVAHYDRLRLHSFMKINDWGPFDYHRDFNFTFPLQLMGDMSYIFGTPDWLGMPQTRLGLRGTWRSLDRFSGDRFCPTQIPAGDGTFACSPLGLDEMGREWEIRTYLSFVMN